METSYLSIGTFSRAKSNHAAQICVSIPNVFTPRCAQMDQRSTITWGAEIAGVPRCVGDSESDPGGSDM